MTDNQFDNDENNVDNLEDALAQYRDNRPPRDPYAPPNPPTREEILRLNDVVGTEVAFTEWPTVVPDADGIPTPVGEFKTSRVPVAAVMFTRTQLEVAGVSPEEVPNVRVIDE